MPDRRVPPGTAGSASSQESPAPSHTSPEGPSMYSERAGRPSGRTATEAGRAASPRRARSAPGPPMVRESLA